MIVLVDNISIPVISIILLIDQILLIPKLLKSLLIPKLLSRLSDSFPPQPA